MKSTSFIIKHQKDDVMSKLFPIGTEAGNSGQKVSAGGGGRCGSAVKFAQHEVCDPCVRAGLDAQHARMILIGFAHRIAQTCAHGVAVDDSDAVNAVGERAQAAVYENFCLIAVFAVQVDDYGSGLRGNQLLLLI
ncbi:MAG: hypothetical protein LBS36_05345 [Oscillospiraceae bacterium]|jgi:hypothetical protein|nr:hypothetical protein [Oscillospiraceae bacterium]